MGNITIQGDLTGDVPGGEVGGASNLTTVGAIPYVSSAGILNQDPTNLFWDSANARLGVGTNAPTAPLTVAGGGIAITGSTSGAALTITNGTAIRSNTAASTTYIDLGTAIFRQGNGGNPSGGGTTYFGGSTGNWVLGGSGTDGNYKLDVASSGSSGTLRVYDQTAVTGSTLAVIQAGAGQSGNLQEWRNNAGTQLAYVASDGIIWTSSFRTTSNGLFIQDDGNYVTAMRNSWRATWSSNTSAGGPADLSLSRSAAGVLQVGDGGSNANGQLNSKALTATGTLSAFNSTGGLYITGNAGSSWATIQSYSDGAGTSKATAINPSGGNVLIGTTTDDGTNKLQVTGTVKVTNASNNITLSGSSGQTPGILFNQSAVGNYYIRSQASTSDLEFLNDNANRMLKISQQGTLQLYNETATTGVTKAVVRAGAGQSSTNLTEWQNNAGTVLAYVGNTGGVVGEAVYGRTIKNSPAGVAFAFHDGVYSTAGGYFQSTFPLVWNSDAGISRSSAGLLEINSGTAGTLRDLYLRRERFEAVTVANLPAAASWPGTVQYVTDANATTIGSTVAGGGANKVLVWSDGTNWKIFAS